MPTDYPREQIMQMASDAIATHGGPARARVYFKFTCEACGARCTFNEPNALYESGECCDCGHMTTIAAAGYSLLLSTTGVPLATILDS